MAYSMYLFQLAVMDEVAVSIVAAESGAVISAMRDTSLARFDDGNQHRLMVNKWKNQRVAVVIGSGLKKMTACSRKRGKAYGEDSRNGSSVIDVDDRLPGLIQPAPLDIGLHPTWREGGTDCVMVRAKSVGADGVMH